MRKISQLFLMPKQNENKNAAFDDLDGEWVDRTDRL